MIPHAPDSMLILANGDRDSDIALRSLSEVAGGGDGEPNKWSDRVLSGLIAVEFLLSRLEFRGENDESGRQLVSCELRTGPIVYVPFCHHHMGHVDRPAVCGIMGGCPSRS
jgi:hypothetical protein